VADTLARTGLDPRAVALEITESRLLPDTPGMHQVLTELQALGVHMTVDDFGTGYANLGYLAMFPFDVLKIDRTYVSHLTEDNPNGRLAEGVFALARATGLITVAEGIETPEEREAVLATGCHLAQGFLFAKPLPAGDLEALLHAESGTPAAVTVAAQRRDRSLTPT
jgi:EAL domain-containing protein (putative c-di-GMP-specific phosphodiesterase class I)